MKEFCSANDTIIQLSRELTFGEAMLAKFKTTECF